MNPGHAKSGDARGINYAAAGSVIGIELLSPRRKGAVLEGLPFADDVSRVVHSGGSSMGGDVDRSRRTSRAARNANR